MEQKKLAVEKWIWGDADFGKMGGMIVGFMESRGMEKVDWDEEKGPEGHFGGVELLLDIDHILKWDRAWGVSPFQNGHAHSASEQNFVSLT
jgi:hypothetical protein